MITYMEKTLSVLVNTDVKMSKRMLDALHIFETTKVMQRATSTTEEEVRAFLEKYELADKFRPEYMLRSRDS